MTDAFIDPNRAQFEAFKELDRDRPIEMFNLVRFHAVARYPEGHENAGISGAEAYQLYSQNSGAIFSRVGGEIIWRGRFEACLIGPSEERWDASFIARYPTAHAFFEMISDPDYQKAVIHRQAAVETSRLLRHAPEAGGTSFG